MNKLAIPAILTATVLIAGIFAFRPVNNARTVHNLIIAALSGQLAGANLLRIQTDIDQIDSSGSVTWTQLITFDRVTGDGAWQIEKLYICDLDTSGEQVTVGFDIETNIVDANDTGPTKIVGHLIGVLLAKKSKEKYH